jgi:hypothetical protein
MQPLLDSMGLSSLPPWVVPAIGAGATFFVLLFGYLLLGRKAPPRPSELPKPSTYPFAALEVDQRDQRKSLRRTGNPVDVLINAADVKGAGRPGMVIDRSPRGLCLTSDAAEEVGALIRVRSTSAPATTPWIRLMVRNCRLVGRNYELGCEFIEPPPASVMLYFG